MRSTTKRSHVHKETGILMTACGKNCMNHKFVEKKKGKINMKTVKELNKLLAFVLRLHKNKIIDYPTYCIFQGHLVNIMNTVVELPKTKGDKRN